MKSLNLLSIVIIVAISGQAIAQAPPPLKPVEYLEPDDVKTTPAKPVTPPPVVTQPAKPTTPVIAPVSQPPKPPVAVQPAPQPTTKPANPPVVVQPPKPTTPVVQPPKPTTPVVQPPKPTTPVATQPPKPVAQPPKPVVTQPKPPVRPSKVGAFRIGDEVATDRHEIGVIVDFPSNQSALVRFDRQTQEWPTNRLSFLLESARGFRVGEVVVTDRHERGVIELIFADETAVVRMGRDAFTWPLNRLSHEITSIDGYTIGMEVVTDRHDTGVIVEVFSDRTAVVRFQNGTYVWPLNRLSRGVRELDGFKVGQSVATDRRDTGVIVEIFADRTANVRFRGGEIYNWPLNRLGPAFYGQR